MLARFTENKIILVATVLMLGLAIIGTSVAAGPAIMNWLFPPPPPYSLTLADGNYTFQSTFGFSVAYPDTFHSDVSSYQNMPELTVYLTSDHLVLDVFRTDNTYQGQDLTLVDVITGHINTIKQQLPSAQIISEGSTTLGGQAAYKVVFTYEDSNGNQDTAGWIFGMVNGRVYDTEFVAPSVYYNSYVPFADPLFNSFQFTQSS